MAMTMTNLCFQGFATASSPGAVTPVSGSRVAFVAFSLNTVDCYIDDDCYVEYGDGDDGGVESDIRGGSKIW